MLALITFYRFAHQVLRNYSILSKFMLIKVIIFLNVVYVCAYGHCAPVRTYARASPGWTSGKPLRSTIWAHTRSWSRATPSRPRCVPRV
jgi:hypothetical protein